MRSYFQPVILTLRDNTPIEKETFITIVHKLDDLKYSYNTLVLLAHNIISLESLSKKELKEIQIIGFTDQNEQVYEIVIKVIKCLTRIQSGKIKPKYPFL
jgi:hypothetical protein